MYVGKKYIYTDPTYPKNVKILFDSDNRHIDRIYPPSILFAFDWWSRNIDPVYRRNEKIKIVWDNVFRERNFLLPKTKNQNQQTKRRRLKVGNEQRIDCPFPMTVSILCTFENLHRKKNIKTRWKDEQPSKGKMQRITSRKKKKIYCRISSVSIGICTTKWIERNEIDCEVFETGNVNRCE